MCLKIMDVSRNRKVCYCPKDYIGINCDTWREFTCSVLNADGTTCVPITRSGFDPALPGEPACHYVGIDDTIKMKLKLSCSFISGYVSAGVGSIYK